MIKILKLITALRRSGKEQIDPVAKQRIIGRLMQEHQSVSSSAAQESVFINSGFRLRLSVASIVIVALLTILITTTVAAQAAKPGDFLYAWERGVEQVRLSFTLNERARVTYAVQLAEKRAEELQEVKKAHPDIVRAVRKETSRAIQKAIDSVSKAAQKDKAQKSASPINKNVTERLEHLQERQREETSSASASGLTSAKAQIKGNSASVSIEVNGEKTTFTVSSANDEDIIKEIVKRTGTSETRVKVVLTIKKESAESENKGAEARSSVNVSVNSNSQVNVNVRSESSAQGSKKQSSKTSITVEVDQDEGIADIETLVNGKAESWELHTTDQSEILASIVARTGLPAADIKSIWEYSAF